MYFLLCIQNTSCEVVFSYFNSLNIIFSCIIFPYLINSNMKCNCEIQATLTMSADVLKSAMCYVLEDPTMEPIFLSASVIANQVKCSSFTPWKAKYYYIGVSYINELVAGTVK